MLREEDVRIDKIYGHGGLFKTPLVGQKVLAAAIHAPVTVMATAGEGGAWGIALLASYMAFVQQEGAAGESLESYLAHVIFKDENSTTAQLDEKDEESFDDFIKRYKKALAVEQSAVDNF